MECMNNQFVAIDSNYFLFSKHADSAYVLKYPGSTSLYEDIWTPADTVPYTAVYKSGWINPGQMKYKSMIQEFDIIAYNAGVSSPLNNVGIAKDFEDTTVWDSSGFAGGNRFHHYENIGIGGNYGYDIWQINVVESSEYDFFLSGYRLQAWLRGK